jgi:hypothetical protein
MPAGPALPAKYERLAKKSKEFAWVRSVTRNDQAAGGSGWERIDGSSIYSWFAFTRIDLDNDSVCDWYVDASAPMSTGGDRDTIDTLYLGRKDGWTRSGATLPDDKPDELGFGASYDQQARYLFGEEPAVIHDAAGNVNYLVTALYDRHVQRNTAPGYRILAWEADKRTLRALDKWEPGSKAAAVYAYFKAHGAYRPAQKTAGPDDRKVAFDPEVEAYELEQACEPDNTPEGWSRHLLAHCKPTPRQ